MEFVEGEWLRLSKAHEPHDLYLGPIFRKWPICAISHFGFFYNFNFSLRSAEFYSQGRFDKGMK